jgi:hypothetical protein
MFEHSRACTPSRGWARRAAPKAPGVASMSKSGGVSASHCLTVGQGSARHRRRTCRAAFRFGMPAKMSPGRKACA